MLGPTAVLQLAERDEPPPPSSRPLYSLAMRGAVICFSGFRKKDELVSTRHITARLSNAVAMCTYKAS